MKLTLKLVSSVIALGIMGGGAIAQSNQPLVSKPLVDKNNQVPKDFDREERAQRAAEALASRNKRSAVSDAEITGVSGAQNLPVGSDIYAWSCNGSNISSVTADAVANISISGKARNEDGKLIRDLQWTVFDLTSAMPTSPVQKIVKTSGFLLKADCTPLAAGKRREYVVLMSALENGKSTSTDVVRVQIIALAQ